MQWPRGPPGSYCPHRNGALATGDFVGIGFAENLAIALEELFRKGSRCRCTSAFLRARIDEELAKRKLAPRIFGTASEAEASLSAGGPALVAS